MRKKKKFPKILASILGVFAICGFVASVASVQDDQNTLCFSVDRKDSLTVTNNGVDDYLFSYNDEMAIVTTPDSGGVSTASRNVTSATFDASLRVYRGVDEQYGSYWAVSTSLVSVSAPTFGTLWSNITSSGYLQSGWEYFTALGGGLSYAGNPVTWKAFDVSNARYAYLLYMFSVDDAKTVDNLSSDVERKFYCKFGIHFSVEPITNWDTGTFTSLTFGTSNKLVTFNKGFTTQEAYKYVNSTYSYSSFGNNQIGRVFPLACIDFSLWSSDQASYDRGYQAGYDKGYSDGDSVNENMATIFSGIIDIGLLPINVFLDIFNFEVFGINFKPLVAGLLTALVAIIIFRMFVGKGGGGSE